MDSAAPVDSETIPGERHALWERVVNLGMLDLVGHVNKPRPAGPDGVGLFHSVVAVQVGVVPSLAEHVQKQRLKAHQARPCFVRDV